MIKPARWHWPTGEGWFFIITLTLVACEAGGVRGGAIMLGFFVTVNVLGNWLVR